MFKVVCVGYDGSQHSENAIRAACDISARYGAQIHLVHTPHPETVAFAMGAISGYYAAPPVPSPQDLEQATAEMIKKAKDIAAEAGRSDVITHIGSGDTAKALTDYAKTVDADLIVTGRRGLGNLSALVLGSTSLSVGNLATCAHLTVK